MYTGESPELRVSFRSKHWRARAREKKKLRGAATTPDSFAAEGLIYAKSGDKQARNARGAARLRLQAAAAIYTGKRGKLRRFRDV